MTRPPHETREEYHAETEPDRAPIGSWVAWCIFGGAFVWLALAFLTAWGAQ